MSTTVLTRDAAFETTTVRTTWQSPVLIQNQPTYVDKGKDTRLLHPGLFGSQYARMLFLPDGNWLVVYTIFDNDGYLYDSKGGTALEFSHSDDQGKTWNVVGRLDDPGRDLDNGQMILANNGDILLSCRSVRWQESYELPVYRSADGGRTWTYLSMIDENHGPVGYLGNPDKGMYEPHFYRLHDGRLSVMYAQEKHVVVPPHYSQIVSQKISEDDGATWGEEIFVGWDEANPQLRPGMPVWRRLQDGRYIVVYEVVSLMLTQFVSATIYYKFSDNGVHWEPGLGTPIEHQWGGPYVEQLDSGEILVTSLSGQISCSADGGRTWRLLTPLPFTNHLWPSLYPLNGSDFVLLNSPSRSEGGNNIQIAIGSISLDATTVLAPGGNRP